MYQLLFNCMVIAEVYTSFMRSETIFTKSCLVQWISELHRSWARQIVLMFKIVVLSSDSIVPTALHISLQLNSTDVDFHMLYKLRG